MIYNEENLNRVVQAILDNLTPDLLPKYMREKNLNGGRGIGYGHCHNAAGVLYKIFGYKNLHMYRALDFEGIYHWWVVDKNGQIIDPTADQYLLIGQVPPYLQGAKASLLGFAYRDRVNTLLQRVRDTLQDVKYVVI